MATDEDVEGLTDQFLKDEKTEPCNSSDNECATDNLLESYLENEDKDGFIMAYRSRDKRFPCFQKASVGLSNFLKNLNDVCFGRAVRYLSDEQIFVIHELLRYTKDLNNVRFLKDKMDLLRGYERDSHQQTWLHAAAQNGDRELIQFVINELNIGLNCQNDKGETALHTFCANVTGNNKEVKGTVSILMGKGNKKTMMAHRNIARSTPAPEIQFPMTDLGDKVIGMDFDNDNFRMIAAMRRHDPIDDVYEHAEYDSASYWIAVLRENNRSMLMADMVDVEGFTKKYSMNYSTFKRVLNDCDFGNGLNNETAQNIKTIISESDEPPDISEFFGIGKCEFFQSAPFLALLLGQWNLVMPLVAFSRFDTVPFCVLTCHVCVKMQQWRNISETVRQKIDSVHQSADAYLTEIVNVMFAKYSRNVGYDIVYEYLTKPTSSFNGSLTNVGLFANCKKFFNSLACQSIFNRLWKEKQGHCFSSFHKFVFHSFVHIGFLLCLFSVLLKDRNPQIGGLEIFCYLYGIGYFVEEVRQMLYYHRMGHFAHYFHDATNVVDLVGLASLLTAFIFRCSLSFSYDAVNSMERQSKISFYINFIACLYFSLTAIFMSVRLLYFLSVFESFGPKLKMIERMIFVDLLPVSVIFLVFILSFGVSFQSLLFSDFSNKTISIERNSSSNAKRLIALIADILWQPTFTIFEPKFVIEGATENKSPSIQNPMMKLIVQFLLIMFIIIVSVMLMNMLIALFSQTVSDVSITAKESWAIDQWKFIAEYMEKSYLVPPLNIFEIIFVVIKSFFRKQNCAKTRDNQMGIEKSDVNPFTNLCLPKETKFELLKAAETSVIADKDAVRADQHLNEALDLLRKKIENVEELLNNRKSRLSMESTSQS